jgi:DNA-binding IscR family transcriptional regulator
MTKDVIMKISTKGRYGLRMLTASVTHNAWKQVEETIKTAMAGITLMELIQNQKEQESKESMNYVI